MKKGSSSVVLGARPTGEPVQIDMERLVQSRMLAQANSGAGKTWLLRRLAEESYGKLGGGEREILSALVSAWPSYVSRDRLTEETGYKRSSRDTYLQRLRSRQLIEAAGTTVRASEVLFAYP